MYSRSLDWGRVASFIIIENTVMSPFLGGVEVVR